MPLLLGAAGSLFIAAAAEAGTLQTWRFNANDNRLTFTTDEGVQPRAQLITNPTRLVIDLPGTMVGRPATPQTFGGAIRQVRVGQFDAQTTRIVIELSPGYTLNPQQVLVRGRTPTDWSVQLPTPEPDLTAENPNSPPDNSAPRPSGGVTYLEGVQVTEDGIFLRTSGASARVERQRQRDRNRVTFELENTRLSPELTQQEYAINRLGVNRLQITQAESSPPVARVTLTLSNSRNSRDNDRTPLTWQASASNLGGIVLIPGRGNGTVGSAPTPTQPAPNPQPPATGLATIQTVELTAGGSQLLVRADQPIRYSSGWDRSTNAYRITIPNARLAERVMGPRLTSSSSLRRVRLLQADEQTVAVLVEPASGVLIQEVVQPSRQMLALQLQQVAERPSTPRPPANTPETPPSTPDLPRVPSGRLVVVVDPGHGGSDPGAIGVGGIQEADITLAIASQVASILDQQGVQAVLTRRDDRDVELEPRVQIAEQANANLFVSIHCNSISLARPDVNGLETYYYSDAGSRLGQVIHRSIVQTMGMPDRGLRQARFYVIKNTSMPAVLVETGFVTGAEDARNFSNPQWRTRMAQAIARGILQYIQQNISSR